MTPAATPGSNDTSSVLDSVEQAIADIAAGKAIIVVDDEDRENEGDLIFAAELATPELVAFMVRYSSGYVCVGMEPADCERLGLPPMVALNEDVRGTAYTITVDAAEGVDTGISAQDRAHTIRLLSSAETDRRDLNRPGHVVPLRAKRGGVLARPGHTEASVDLSRAAGLRPAGVLCEIVSEEDPTTMARLPELRRFADRHGLTLISIEQLVQWRRRHESVVERCVETRLPTSHGEFTAVGYRHLVDGTEYVALVAGELTDGRIAPGTDVPVRLHSECLTGDVFGSLRCDCGQQLDAALSAINADQRGVVIYLRGHEGRGIGLLPKLRAYVLQDEGLDTVEANVALGYDADQREYSAAAHIIADLGIESVALMSNNPAKQQALTDLGITVSRRIPVSVPANPNNESYLRTKRDRMGHQLDSLADSSSKPSHQKD